ncbi:oligosaccharide flippase family protein [Lachnospiraceae bacterium 62-26]
MLEKLWENEEKDIEKNCVFWNMISSGLNSVVSMVLLWVVTRVNGVVDAGIFSLGFSTSQMMLTIGNYGMRNYQVTDIRDKYSMRVYLASRVVTNVIMMVIVIGFVGLEGYTFEKAVITILLSLLKATDAFDDVYGGYYQKKGRLDVSGKLMSLRIILYVIGFCVCLILSNDLIIGCLAAIIISSITLSTLVASTRQIAILEKPEFNWKKITLLLKECFPLCISAYLLIYMGNAPKYAIDTYLDASEQAYFTYLFMPCFVINLFVGFILQPLLVRLSKSWLHKEYRKFLKICGMIFAVALVIAGFIVVAGGMLGCQILTVVFGVQLMQYRDVLIVLLIGGSFFTFAVIEQVILTVMRRQIWLLVGFILASTTAFVVSDSLVDSWKLLGAGYAYTLSAGILFLVLLMMILLFLYNEKKRNKVLL